MTFVGLKYSKVNVRIVWWKTHPKGLFHVGIITGPDCEGLKKYGKVSIFL